MTDRTLLSKASVVVRIFYCRRIIAATNRNLTL